MASADQSVLHLHPLVPADLPTHPTLAPHQQSSPDTSSFVKRVLDEATALIDTALPQSFHSVSKSKASPPSAAPVELLSCSISASSLPSHVKKEGSSSSKGEAWFARRSVHENAETAGTASMAEFEEGLLRNHSANEMDYTPDVYDAHKVLEWSNEQVQSVEGYEEVGMYSECAFQSTYSEFKERQALLDIKNRIDSTVMCVCSRRNVSSHTATAVKPSLLCPRRHCSYAEPHIP